MATTNAKVGITDAENLFLVLKFFIYNEFKVVFRYKGTQK